MLAEVPRRVVVCAVGVVLVWVRVRLRLRLQMDHPGYDVVRAKLNERPTAPCWTLALALVGQHAWLGREGRTGMVLVGMHMWVRVPFARVDAVLVWVWVEVRLRMRVRAMGMRGVPMTLAGILVRSMTVTESPRVRGPIAL